MKTRFGPRRLHAAMLAAAVCSVGAPAMADDLTGADRFLCSTLQATVCLADGECAVLSPADLNIPQFLEVDLEKKHLATTAASGENRRTPAETVRRVGQDIFLQGYEAGRAFSLLIQETTGQAAFASVAEDRSVVVFAACTPMPGR